MSVTQKFVSILTENVELWRQILLVFLLSIFLM